MKEGYRLLGDFIQPVDERNRDLKVDYLLGVSISKQFIPSIANIVGTDLSSYKIVRTGQFAYGPVTSRNGEKISIALLRDKDCIISSSYTVFEVVNKNALDPEYLMLWFSRPEFDRYARYMSHGSVREIFDWDELCKVELPVPSIDKQRSIVKAYQTITERIELKRRINDNLVELCKTEFMRTFATHPEYRDEQSDWFSHPLGKSLSRVAMGPFGSNIKTDCFVDHGVPVLNGDNISGYLLSERSFRYVEDEKASQLKNSIAVSGDIVITHRGTLGQVALVPDKTKFDRYVISQSQFLLACDQCALLPEYVLFYFHTDAGRRKLLANDNTTGVPSIAKPTSYIKALHIPIPPIELQQNWAVLVRATLAAVADNNLEMEKLTDFAQTLLSGLSR
jgi:type I restriction enzyme S subunit